MHVVFHARTSCRRCSKKRQEGIETDVKHEERRVHCRLSQQPKSRLPTLEVHAVMRSFIQ